MHFAVAFAGAFASAAVGALELLAVVVAVELLAVVLALLWDRVFVGVVEVGSVVVAAVVLSAVADFLRPDFLAGAGWVELAGLDEAVV